MNDTLMSTYKKKETYPKGLTEDLMDRFEFILKGVGEDPEREGLIKTPERAAKAIQFLTHGYSLDAEKVLKSAMFKDCLLYTSPSPRDQRGSRMPSSA